MIIEKDSEHPMLIDSHCHLDSLDLDAYGGQLEPVLQQARDGGVVRILSVATHLSSHRNRLNLIEPYDFIDLSVGIHPLELETCSGESREQRFKTLCEQASHPRVVALGETGLDYHYDTNPLSLVQQQEAFRDHIRVARQLKKPLIVHTRQARQDTLTILREEKAVDVGGVMHCFTEDWSMACQAMDMGFFISFSGIVTFKNAVNVQQVAAQVPSDRLLIETDAPYLTPVPYRGKPNQPAYVRYVAEYLSKLRQIDITQLAQQTSANYQQFLMSK